MPDVIALILFVGTVVAFVQGWRRHSRRNPNAPPRAQRSLLQMLVRFGWFLLFVLSIYGGLVCLIHSVFLVGVGTDQAARALPAPLGELWLLPISVALGGALTMAAGWCLRAWFKSYSFTKSNLT